MIIIKPLAEQLSEECQDPGGDTALAVSGVCRGRGAGQHRDSGSSCCKRTKFPRNIRGNSLNLKWGKTGGIYQKG